MSFSEYKEEIKKAFVKMWEDAGKKVENPDDIFTYTPDDIVMEMYNKDITPQEAMFACGMRSIQIKKPKSK